MATVDFDRYDSYQEWRETAEKYYATHLKYREQVYKGKEVSPEVYMNTYLSRHADMQHDERERLCVVVPLIRLMLEKMELPDALRGELEYYHFECFYEGGELNLDDLFTEEELALIEEDLEWAYTHSGLEEEDNA